MKHTSLAFAAALLGATALAPAAWAQTPAPAETPTPQSQPTSPTTSGPSTSSPSASAGDNEQSNWRSSWRSDWRDDDDDDDRSRWSRGRYDRDDDDHDEDHGSRSDRDREGAPWMRGRGMETGGRQDRGTDGMGMSGAKMRGMSPEMARMHSRMMRAHHGMGPRGMMGPRQQGARLNLKRGEATINIRCPADEPIAACVDAVTKLMDKLHSVPQTP